jgi:hypothetical protein
MTEALMLLSTLRKLSSILFCLLFANSAYAFDSTQAFNTITFSYVDQANVSQIINLSDAQRSTASSITLTVDAKDGGGRPTHNLDGTCAAYCTQYDVSRIRIHVFNSSGTSIGTMTTTTNLMNWGSSSNPGWSTGPGDNQHPWTTASVTLNAADITGGFAAVAYVRVYLISDEGSFWAGNYGVQYRTPTLQINGEGNNLLYNSEFGVDSSGVKVQGWTPSYSSYSTCGTTSGNLICATEESTVTANMWGGGEDPNGGTISGQEGGYSSVLTADNADTAAEGGDIGGGGSATPPPPTPVYRSSAITQQQATRRGSNLADTTGHNAGVSITGDGNDVYILQAGTGGHYASVSIQDNSNDVDVNQTSTIGARHYLEAAIIGSSNIIDATQSDTAKTQFVSVNGNNNNITTSQTGTGNHFLDLSITGDDHTAGVTQRGSGNHEARVTLDGSQPWNFNLTQDGSTSQRYTLPHDMSDGSVVSGSGTCSTIGGCNLTINQQ